MDDSGNDDGLLGMGNTGVEPRWLAELVTKVPFGLGKPQLRPPRCDITATPNEKPRSLARRAQETEQTSERAESTIPPSHYARPTYDFELRASHARTYLPAALASVSFGFVLLRVRTRRALVKVKGSL